jgi:flavin-dependent dehydrogenase
MPMSVPQQGSEPNTCEGGSLDDSACAFYGKIITVSVTDVAGVYDVAVLGGGPAGCAAAIELATHGRTVLLLERSQYDDARIGETLAPQAAPWLRRFGLSNAFASVPHLPAPGVVRLWESPVVLSDALTFEQERNGWHIDRTRFDALLAVAAERAGAVVRRGAVARSCESRGDQGWTLDFDTHEGRTRVDARWLIDATGRRSWLLHGQGVRPTVLDRLVGLLGYGGPRASDDRDLFVEATPTGWWYSAPLPGGRSVAAFMTDGDLIARDGRGLASFWEERRASSELISSLHGPAATLRTVVARTACSATLIGRRWLAVGDAAAAFDPLFGLGICHALASGWTGARALIEAAAQGAVAMGRYQVWSESRYREYLAMRRRVYGGVTRWPDSPFWRRRTLE